MVHELLEIQFKIITVCTYRYVITMGLRRKYDGDLRRESLRILNMTYVAMLHSAVVMYAKI